MRALRTFGSYWLPVVALALPALPAQRNVGKTQPVPPAPQDLVWPLPPSQPRIRWLDQFSTTGQSKGKVQMKRSWMERAAGAKSQKEERESHLRQPYGIAVDSQGRIYVADGSQRTVFVFDRDRLRVETRKGSGRLPLAVPVGVAVGEGDRLFVSDAFLHSVVCFDADGKPIAQFGTDKLERAAGLALDRGRRRLYVVDVKANRVAVFDSEKFEFLRYIGGPSTPEGLEPGRFSAPANAAVDRAGNLFVTDTWNHRVQVFDAQGKFVRAFGTHGVRPGNFVRPKGIAVDSEGHIYVADSEFNNFQVFTPEGQPLLAVGALGNAPGEFTLLAGLAIDAEDRIYTTEQFNGRVQIFRYLPSARSGKEVSQLTK